MGFFLVYILKSAFCLTLFYLFYRLLLSKETFHRFNRFTLLGILSLSLFLPLIEINSSGSGRVHQAVMSVEQALSSSPEVVQSVTDAGLASAAEAENLPAAYPTGGLSAKPVYATDDREYEESVSTETSFTWVEAVMLVYLSGVLLLLLYSICSLLRMVMLLRSGSFHRQEDGMVLVVHDREVPPFSWLKYVVVSRRDLEEGGREILLHEKAHYSHCHSLDLLFVDICVFFQWFNPFAWLLKRDLRAIHEYEADASVLASGVDSRDYQLLLIKKSVGTRLYAMASSFKEYKLKNRIHMMLKRKSNPWVRLKCLYMLPLAGIVLMAFARPEVGEKANELSAVSVEDLTAAAEGWLKNKVVTVKPDTVQVEELWGKSIRVKGVTQGKEPLLVVDGKEQDYIVLSRLNPEFIKSISRSEKSEEHVNGVINVKLYTKYQLDSLKGWGDYFKEKNEQSLRYVRKHGGDSTLIMTYPSQSRKRIVYVNGKEASGAMEDALQIRGITFTSTGDVCKINITPENQILAVQEQEKERKKGNAYDYYARDGWWEDTQHIVSCWFNYREMSLDEFVAHMKETPADSVASWSRGVTNGDVELRVSTMGSYYLLNTIKGVVKDELGNPVPNAYVRTKEYSGGTSTDENGCFRINVPKWGGTLTVSADYAEMEPMVMKVKEVRDLEIVLKKKEHKLRLGNLW